MNPGDIILVDFPTVNGPKTKLRPVLVLAALPGPYQQWLFCGISTQIDNMTPKWDELLDDSADWFAATGLARRSAIRLSFLAAAPASPPGRLGVIPNVLLAVLQSRLARHLAGSHPPSLTIESPDLL